MSIHETARRHRIDIDKASVLVALAVMSAVGAVAASGAVVTSAGFDQREFHLPTVLALRADFPGIDLVGIQTATGPVYHLVVAAVSGPFSMGEAGTQTVGGLFAAALAALLVWHTRGLTSTAARALVVAPLLLSAYFWQSAVWMLTDDAALLFATAALVLLLRPLTLRREIVIGLLIALAVGTRQTSIWLVAPALVACWSAGLPAEWRTRVPSLLRMVGPTAVVLGVLVGVWGGLTPPAGREFNAGGASPVSVSFTFAVAALLAVPVLLSLSWRRPQRWSSVALVAAVAALPAVIFPSAATVSPDHARRGGLVWRVVQAGGDVAGRSPVLVLLAFVGAAACVMVFLALERATAWVLAASVVALGLVDTAGAQLFQKYAELPIAAVTVLALTHLWARGLVVRRWPLVALGLLQLAMTAGLIVLPVLRA